MSTSLKILLSIIILIQVTVTNAQESKEGISVPIIVQESFSEKFPSVEPVWDIHYQGTYNQELVYKGKFLFKNRSSLVVFDKDGNMVAFAATIEKNEIPVKIKTYMNEKFPAFPIVEALLVTREKQETTYEVGIYVNEQYVIKVFTEDGDFIKTTKG